MLTPLLCRLPRMLFALLAVLIAGLWSARPAQATHLLGGEMTYRYLDANGPAAAPFRYELTVVVYNNSLPGAAAARTSASVGVYNRTTGAKLFLSTVNYAGAQGGNMVIPQTSLSNSIQPAVTAGCAVQGPSQPFQLQKFVGVVNLPVSFDGYYAVFTDTARNVDTTNLDGTGNNQPMTLYVSVAPPLLPNHSPVFSDTAVAVVCQNDTTLSLNNAFDADGDRLVYSFGTPYGTFVNSGTNLPNAFPPLPNGVPYKPGYTVAQPFGMGAGNFALMNASTGVARYGGTTQGKYVVAVDVSEYRTINGREVLIGVTRRDLQLIVAACPATPPPALPTLTPRSYTVEEGQPLSFAIAATQANNHPLVLTVNSALLDGAGAGGFDASFNGNQGTVQPGNLTGTAAATGTGTVSGTFRFNSRCGNYRATPYDVAVTVKDNGCGGKLIADVFRVTVTRAPAPNRVAGDSIICNPGQVRTYAAVGPVPTAYRWRVQGGTVVGSAAGPSVQVQWPATGAASGRVVLRGVSAFGCLSDSVVKDVSIVQNLPPLTFSGNLTVCPGASTALTVAGGTGLYTLTGGGVTLTGAGPFTVTPAQTTVYTATGLTAQGCANAGTVTVTVQAPAVSPGPDVVLCPGGSAVVGTPGLPGYTYQWSGNLGPGASLSSATAAQPTLTNNPTGTGAASGNLTLTVTSPAGCVATAQLPVLLLGQVAAFAGPARAVCSGAPTTLGTLPTPPALATGYAYQWSPATGLSSATAAQPTLTLTNTGTTPQVVKYYLTATTPGPSACTKRDSVTVTVNPASANAGPAQTLCSGATSAPLGTAAGNGIPGSTYSWSPATGLSNPAAPQPTATLTNATGAPLTQTYTLTTTTPAGCSATSTVTLTVSPAFAANAGANRATCSGVPTTLGAGGGAQPGFSYSWSPATGLSSTSVANPVATLTNATAAPLTQTYTLSVTNAQGCVGTGTVAVTVSPAATADAGPDATACADQRLRLGTPGLPGYAYAWTPAAGLSSASAAQPTATVRNATAAPVVQKFVLTATSAQGCVARDSVLVTVNPRPAADSINGSVSVCPTVQGVAYSVRRPRFAAYQWLVTGGTVASGQGTPAITVNWGPAGAGAVKVFTLNAATGCSSDTVSLPVVVNPRLQTAKPVGPGAAPGAGICQAGGPYVYQTNPYTNGSSYSWQFFGTAQAQQVSTNLNAVTVNWTTPGTGKIVVTETSNPAGGRCLGVSDTLFVTVLPSPAANLALQGPARACAGSGPVTFRLPGAAASSYVFQVNGAAAAAAGNTLTLPASLTNTPGTYAITARETGANRCAGPLYTATFIVDPRPAPLAIAGPSFVCPGGGALAYSVPSTPGSTYQWSVTGGGTVASGQGTAQVTVNFDPGVVFVRTVTVTETSGFGCAGPLAALRVTPDNAQAPVLAVASVDPNDNGKVVLTYQVTDGQNTPNPVRILRRDAGSTGTFAQVGTASATATSFADATANAAATSYEYRLELANGCGAVLAGASATTVRLAAAATPGTGGDNQGSVQLSWNAYQGFAVAGYRLYRRNDGGQYELVKGDFGPNDRQYTVPNSGRGFEQCFRLVAVSTDAAPREANSNSACVTFENPVASYNVITPNGDGANDALHIDNIQLYPGHTVTVYNRWGREVWQTTNYDNDRNRWGDDPNLAPGVYYYLVKLPNGTSQKSWVEVVK